MRQLIVISAIATLLALASPSEANEIPESGTLSGVVTGEDGTPILGATVRYIRFTELARDSFGHYSLAGPVVSSATTTWANGGFSVTGLPLGRYSVCAFGPSPQQFGSCEWGKLPSLVVIDATNPSADVRLTVYRGAAVTVAVRDPNGRIDSSHPFMVGFLSDSGYYKGLASGVRTGSDFAYHFALPPDFKGRLFIDSVLSVRDGHGAAVPTRQPALPVALSGLGGTVIDLTLP